MSMKSNAPRPKARKPNSKTRGYLLLEVMVSGVILATALVGAMVMTQKASLVLAEASRESQAAQVLNQSISAFLAHPYGTTIPGTSYPSGTDNLTYGDLFKCDRTWSMTATTEVTHAALTLNVEIVTVTVTYNLPNGGQRSITGRARRYQAV